MPDEPLMPFFAFSLRFFHAFIRFFSARDFYFASALRLLRHYHYFRLRFIIFTTLRLFHIIFDGCYAFMLLMPIFSS